MAQAKKGNVHRITFANYVKKEVPIRWNQGKTFAVQHQVFLKRGTVALSLLLIARKIYFYWESLPEYPQFSLDSSLNYARITIGMPGKEEEPKRHIHLVFCIDMSSSMQGQRENEVKEGMNAVLNDAAKRVGEKLWVDIAIVGFNSSAQEITPAQSLNAQSVTPILDQVKNYRSNGGTSTVAGVEKACKELENTGAGEHSSAALILLTDGEDNCLNKDQGKKLSLRVAALGAEFFAVGIKGFNKDALLNLTKEENIVDTTKGIGIVDAISLLYRRAIAKFQNLRLHCPELTEKGQWSVRRLSSRDCQWVMSGERGIDFHELAEGETKEFQIKIHLNHVNHPLDLAGLVFKLSFKDPRGIKGEATLPWRGGTIVDPQIISPKK